ncbi:hypothetical protein NG799_23020 [Laspinema sp. D1]|uniref:Uncharacterized protein n=1 Tax=Laspinema palackyanum D2a TaxID=2953684 RepID=A0ABT2MWQ6_9CYAN|nr:hypothetical protein [Laspinema sp. D2a]
MNQAIEQLLFKFIVGKNRTMNDSIFLNSLFLGLIVMGQPSSTLEVTSAALGSHLGLIAMEISTAENSSEICFDDKGNKYHCPSFHETT